jgi:hypothetical protein
MEHDKGDFEESKDCKTQGQIIINHRVLEEMKERMGSL